MVRHASGLLIAFAWASTSRYAAADGAAPTYEAGGGFGASVARRTGVVASPSASFAAGLFVTPWLAMSLRSTTGWATTDLTLYRTVCPEAGDCAVGEAGVFGFIGPAAQAWIGDSVFIGIGLGLAWEYRRDDVGVPYQWDEGLGAELRVGAALATFASGDLLAHVEYFGAIRPDALELPATLSFGLAYQWTCHSRR